MFTLFTTKLLAPQLLPSTLTRGRLLQRLETGITGKLILVSAPAGSGKSTLVASWLQKTGHLTAWLSLDPNDNDPERFFSYLISALQRLEPTFGLELQALVQVQSAVQTELLMNRLIGELASFRRGFLLVFDDYHVITNRAIHESINLLLDHLPHHLCVVITSRIDPDLALSRLRVRGQLIELRADDLRFDVPETEALLNEQLGLALSPSAIARIEGRTEGWAAGLQLAGLSLQGRLDKEAFIDTFAGSHRFLVEYLMSEVLSRQTEQVRSFLKRTSVLERLSAPLCQAVTGQAESQVLLEQMTAANLFLISLDDTQSWYRYHHLFAEFLRHDLRKTDARSVPELNRRASEWFEQEGWVEEAFGHALLAHDFERAAQLAESVAFNLTSQWDNAQLIKYVQKLPPSQLPFHPRLCIYYSWALTNTGQLKTLAEFLPRLEESQNYSDEPYSVAASLLTLHAYEQLRKLKFSEALILSQRALTLLEPARQAQFMSKEEQVSFLFAFNNVAYNYLYSDPARAEALYPESIALCETFGILVGTVNGYARLGRAKRRLGQHHAAIEVFRQGFSALARWQDGQLSAVVNTGELHLSMAGLLYEWNRLKEVEVLHQQAKSLGELSQFLPVLGLELESSLQLHLARGEIEATYPLLDELKRLSAKVHPDNLFHKLMLEVMVMGSIIALAVLAPERDVLLAEVERWVWTRGLGVEDAFDFPHEGEYRILAHLLLAQGKPTEASPLLERLFGAAQAQGRKADLVHYLLLQVLAAQASENVGLAIERLGQALDLAEPEGYCRSFLDLGEPMQRALEMYAKRHPTPYLTGLLQSFSTNQSFTYETPLSPEAPSSTRVQVIDVDRLPSLNDRELTILRLIVAGNSNKGIAKELGMSPNTVRWYVSGLLSKLQVRNRMEAASRARELALV